MDESAEAFPRARVSARTCLTEGVCEDYLRGKLSEAESEQVEGHLLFCELCQQRMAEEQSTFEILRGVAEMAEAEKRSEQEKSRVRHGLPWWQTFFPRHRSRWALGSGLALAALSLFFLIPRGPRMEDYQSVALVEMRSGQPRAAAAAESPLLLKADLRGLEAPMPVLLQVVDGEGRVVESREWNQAGLEAAWPLKTGLAAGDYWVRVAPAANPAALLREYALTVR